MPHQFTHALGASTLPTLHDNSHEKLVDTHADVTELTDQLHAHRDVFRLGGCSGRSLQAPSTPPARNLFVLSNEMVFFSQEDDLFMLEVSGRSARITLLHFRDKLKAETAAILMQNLTTPADQAAMIRHAGLCSPRSTLWHHFASPRDPLGHRHGLVPLRSEAHPAGLPGLSARDQARVDTASIFYDFTAKMVGIHIQKSWPLFLFRQRGLRRAQGHPLPTSHCDQSARNRPCQTKLPHARLLNSLACSPSASDPRCCREVQGHNVPAGSRTIRTFWLGCSGAGSSGSSSPLASTAYLLPTGGCLHTAKDFDQNDVCIGRPSRDRWDQSLGIQVGEPFRLRTVRAWMSASRSMKLTGALPLLSLLWASCPAHDFSATADGQLLVTATFSSPCSRNTCLLPSRLSAT